MPSPTAVIQEYLVPKFRANDYAGGLTDASAALTKLIDGEELPAPMAEAKPAARGNGGTGWSRCLRPSSLRRWCAAIFGRAPSLLRGVVGAGVAGGVAWLLSSLLLVGGLGAAIGFFLGLARPSAAASRAAGPGRIRRRRIWRRRRFGGGGGGGWSGGGGMSGGGGASGSW